MAKVLAGFPINDDAAVCIGSEVEELGGARKDWVASGEGEEKGRESGNRGAYNLWGEDGPGWIPSAEGIYGTCAGVAGACCLSNQRQWGPTPKVSRSKTPGMAWRQACPLVLVRE